MQIIVKRLFRAAGINVPRVTVEPVLPADLMGVFALIPGGI
jgi:hypothetical protein